MKASTMAVLAAVVPSLALANNAMWNGNAGNGSWIDDGNWSAAHPAAGTDVATFNTNATVTVDAGKVVYISHLKVNSGAVTLKATEGSGLRLIKGVTLYDSGFVVGNAASLTLETPIFAAMRFDKWYAGALSIRSAVVLSTSDTVYIGRGENNVIEGDGSFSAPQGNLGVGNGDPSGGKTRLTLKDSAKIDCKDMQLNVASSLGDVGVVQDGAATKVTVSGQMTLGHNGNASEPNPTSYTLKQGTLKVGTMQIGSKIFGSYVQEGGTATVDTVSCGLNGIAGTAELRGGLLEIGSSVVAAKGSFLVTGGELSSAEDDFTVPANIRFSGKPAISAQKGKTVRLPPNLTIDEGTTMTLTGGGTICAMSGACLSPLVIDAGQLMVPIDTTVSRPANPAADWKVRVTNGGSFKLKAITSRVIAPLDLELEQGGKVIFNHSDGDYYARSVLLAHRLVLDGAEQGKGRYQATADGKYFEGQPGASVVVPYVWTGAGDGRRWNDGRNWEGGVVPPNDWTAAVDVSRAAGRTILLEGETRVTLVAFLPMGGAREVTFGGSGSLSLAADAALNVGFLVPADATVNLDVDLKRSTTYKTAAGDLKQIAFVGGGTLRVFRSYPAMGKTGSSNPSENYEPPFVFDGTLAFAGPNARIDVWNDGYNYRALTAQRLEIEGTCKVVFEEGCTFDAWRLFGAPSGFCMPQEFVQRGGTVKLENDLLFINHNTYATSPFAYTMKGGTLVVNENIGLGGYFSANMPRFGGGSFNLEGGEVFAYKLSSESASNYFRLTGGTLNIGTGGFVATQDDRAWNDGWRRVNTEPSLQLGGVLVNVVATTGIKEAIPARLTGIGGDTTFNLGALDLTFTETVDGLGGFVKQGTGTLSFEKAYSASGAIRVQSGSVVFDAELKGVSTLIVESGKVVLNGPVTAKPDFVSLASESSLSLAEGVTMTVARLQIGGVAKAGSVKFGSGTVVVEPKELGTAWTGADEAIWGEGGNWAGGSAPSETGTADLSAACGRMLTLDAATSVAGIAYANGGSVTVSATGSGAFVFPDKATITVDADGELVLDADVTLKGYLYKRGRGKLVLKRKIMSAIKPEEMTSDSSFLVVREGEAEVQGEVSGTRLWTAARADSCAFARITIAPGAKCDNYVTVNPGWKLEECPHNGDIVQNGGVVDMTKLLPNFKKTSNFAFSLPYAGGVATYTLNDGTFILYPDGNANHAIYQKQPGTFRFIQNGGLADLSGLGLCELNSEDVAYEMNGGTLRLREGFKFSLLSHGQSLIALGNGGRVEATGTTELFPAGHRVTLDGALTFATGEGLTATISTDLTGSGAVTHEGPGTLRVATPISGAYDVEAIGGTLLLDAPIGATNVVVGSEVVAQVADAFSREAFLRFVDGGTLHLGSEGEYVVRYLYLDGYRCGPGLYGEGADTLGGRISGPGMLRVLKGGGGIIVIK